MASTLYSTADVAKTLGVSTKAIWNRWTRGTMPEPDAKTHAGRPMWKVETLVKAGVLEAQR